MKASKRGRREKAKDCLLHRFSITVHESKVAILVTHKIGSIKSKNLQTSRLVNLERTDASSAGNVPLKRFESVK